MEETVIHEWEDKLNYRQRKCLNWKTPYEVFYEKNCALNLTIQDVLKLAFFTSLLFVAAEPICQRYWHCEW